MCRKFHANIKIYGDIWANVGFERPRFVDERQCERCFAWCFIQCFRISFNWTKQCGSMFCDHVQRFIISNSMFPYHYRVSRNVFVDPAMFLCIPQCFHVSRSVSVQHHYADRFFTLYCHAQSEKQLSCRFTFRLKTWKLKAKKLNKNKNILGKFTSEEEQKVQ